MEPRLRPTALLLAALLAAAGCDDRSKAKTAAPAPTVATAAPRTANDRTTPAPASQPATQPAATQPSFSYLLINERLEEFPEARVRFLKTDDHVTAILYTADPATAIDNDYSGNSYYLTMPLTLVKQTQDVNGSEWRFRATSSEHNDTTEGIFLKGLKYHLQPTDVLVRFEGDGPTVQVKLAGQFLGFDTANLSRPGDITPISGEILATVETKKK